jgi:CO/xanthine dehydrogenase Mo-binding subunit
LRAAAAEARQLLIAKAAETLGVLQTDLVLIDGTFVAKGGIKRTSYWELAAEQPLAHEATGRVPAKSPSLHKIVGKPVPRIDILAKVVGNPAFVQDTRLPGMVFGRVVRPPSYAAQLVSVDDAAVRKMPGVIAVARDGRFLGVVAEREEQALAARDALVKAARWRVPHQGIAQRIPAQRVPVPGRQRQAG